MGAISDQNIEAVRNGKTWKKKRQCRMETQRK
jgi:hypothetical protein